METRILTVTTAARMLGVDPATVHKWCRRGELRFVRLGGTKKIPLNEILRLTGVKPEDDLSTQQRNS